MEALISTLLSLFGLGEGRSKSISDRRLEAHRINSEAEAFLHRAIIKVNIEKMRIKHRCLTVAPENTEVILNCEKIFDSIFNDINVAIETIEKSKETLSNASSYSLRPWDEAIAILYRHRGAAESMQQWATDIIAQLDRMLDQVDPQHQSSLGHAGKTID